MTNFRRNANNGVWCCLLMPLALWSAFETTQTISVLKNISFMLACLMSCYTLLMAWQIVFIPNCGKSGTLKQLIKNFIYDLFERASSKEARLKRSAQTVQQKQWPKSNRMSKLFTVNLFLLPIALTFFKVKIPIIIMATASIYFFMTMLPQVFETFPQSFSFGEGALALQTLLVLFFESLSSLVLGLDNPATEEGSFAIIAKGGYISCLTLCFMPLMPGLSWIGKTPFFLVSGIVVLCGFTLPFLWWTLKREPITWVLQLIFRSHHLTLLMTLWSLATIFAVVVVSQQTTQANTRTRKLFHGVIVIVGTAGILTDPNFTYLASVVAICVFTILESMRFYNIAPFGPWIGHCFSIFLDEKDSGKLILTHFYLLIGCFVPLWLSHDLEATCRVKLLSGVLAIGIGDSAASIIGSLFGSIRFPGTKKSLEGVVASVLAQLLFIGLLQRGHLLELTDWSNIYLPIFIASLIEALTTQVDNLVLPIILYVLL